jgi:hypothetical protein
MVLHDLIQLLYNNQLLYNLLYNYHKYRIAVHGQKHKIQMAQLQELALALSDPLLALLIIVLHLYWIYKLATYNWDNFDEDSKNDDFLKPYDK